MIHNIQYLRAFAAISVVLFHIIGRGASYSQNPEILSALRPWTANGVDIFFVISGFVMMHTQINRPKSVTEFYRSRLVRIAPVYWLLTSLYVLIYWFNPAIFRDVALSLQWIFTSYFFGAQLIAGSSPLIDVGWTLEWEMLFYLLFGAGICVRSLQLGAFIVVAALFFLAWFSGQWLVLEFALGMLIAAVCHKRSIRPSTGLAMLGLGVLGLLLTLVDELRVVDRLIFWGLPAFLIVFGAVACTQLNSRFFKYLGAASYSIYLVQVFTIPAFYKASSQLALGINYDLVALACLLCSVAFGCLVYSFVEKPITARLRR